MRPIPTPSARRAALGVVAALTGAAGCTTASTTSSSAASPCNVLSSRQAGRLLGAASDHVSVDGIDGRICNYRVSHGSGSPPAVLSVTVDRSTKAVDAFRSIPDSPQLTIVTVAGRRAVWTSPTGGSLISESRGAVVTITPLNVPNAQHVAEQAMREAFAHL